MTRSILLCALSMSVACSSAHGPTAGADGGSPCTTTCFRTTPDCCDAGDTVTVCSEAECPSGYSASCATHCEPEPPRPSACSYFNSDTIGLDSTLANDEVFLGTVVEVSEEGVAIALDDREVSFRTGPAPNPDFYEGQEVAIRTQSVAGYQAQGVWPADRPATTPPALAAVRGHWIPTEPLEVFGITLAVGSRECTFSDGECSENSVHSLLASDAEGSPPTEIRTGEWARIGPQGLLVAHAAAVQFDPACPGIVGADFGVVLVEAPAP